MHSGEEPLQVVLESAKRLQLFPDRRGRIVGFPLPPFEFGGQAVAQALEILFPRLLVRDDLCLQAEVVPLGRGNFGQIRGEIVGPAQRRGEQELHHVRAPEHSVKEFCERAQRPTGRCFSQAAAFVKISGDLRAPALFAEEAEVAGASAHEDGAARKG